MKGDYEFNFQRRIVLYGPLWVHVMAVLAFIALVVLLVLELA